MNDLHIDGLENYPELLAQARYEIKSARLRQTCDGCGGELNALVAKYKRRVADLENEKKLRRRQ
jgi:hypothetical protein